MALIVTLAAQGSAPLPRKEVYRKLTPTSKTVEGRPLYSPELSFGNMVFVSGKGPGTNFKGDITAQTRNVLDQIEESLKLAGSSMDKVLKVNVYLTDMNNFAGMNAAYIDRFGDPPPVRYDCCRDRDSRRNARRDRLYCVPLGEPRDVKPPCVVAVACRPVADVARDAGGWTGRRAERARPCRCARPTISSVTGAGDNAAWRKPDWTPLNRRQPEGLAYDSRFKVLYSKTGLYFLDRGNRP